MEIKLNKKQTNDFKVLLDILKKINNETYFKISIDSMVLRAFDPSNAMYYNVEFIKDAFESYNVTDIIEGQINIVDMYKYLSMFKDDLTLVIDNTHVIMTSKTRKAKLPVYEVENECRTLIKTDDNFETILNIESNDFTNMVTDIGIGAENGIYVNVTKDSISFNNGNIHAKPESNINFEKGEIEYTTRYNHMYLKQCILHKLISSLRLRLGDKNLLSILAEGNGVRLELIIAPLGDE